MKTQFVTDDNGNKIAVILPFKEYKKLVDDMNELERIKGVGRAKKEVKNISAKSKKILSLKGKLKTKLTDEDIDKQINSMREEWQRDI